MHLWPAKVITPTTTYEQCILSTDVDGDVIVKSDRSIPLVAMAEESRELVNESPQAWDFYGTDGTIWHAIHMAGNCGCGGTVQYSTVATSQPA